MSNDQLTTIAGATAASAPRHGARRIFSGFARYGIIVLGVISVIFVWLGVSFYIRVERDSAEEAALHTTSNLARAFEEQIIRTVRAVDQTLLYARDAYARNPKQFDALSWWKNTPFITDFTFQLAIIDRNGNLAASNIGSAGRKIDLSDREHFKIHKQSDRDELYISAPVLGRVSRKWSLQLTRRITMPDGTFGGVVVISLDPEYIASFYKSIDLGADGAITLIGSDGIVRARATTHEGDARATAFDSSLMERFRKAASGTIAARSPIDGGERLYSYRAVKDYPMFIVVETSGRDVFASAERNQKTYTASAALLTIVLLYGTVRIWRYQIGLAQARDAAEAGTRARSEFLAMMSHEIRTPMNGVIGTTDLLIRSGVTGEQARLAKTLRDSAAHLLQIINDVLDFSKLEAKRMEFESIEFSLRECIDGAIDMLMPRAREKGLRLTVMVSPAVPDHAVGDPGRLRQILFNLVGNGIKFTKFGSVTVTVQNAGEISPGRLRVAFAVTDTGIGIPADAIGLLFHEFSQLDSSISRRFGGTGLGLAICKRLIDLMGGTITVSSKPGEGSTFAFTIPMQLSDKAPATEADDPSEHPALPPLRILLAEDDRTNRLVATKMLATFGLSADEVTDGAEAVEAATTTAYDIVLMDVMMPELDGLEATRLIRTLPGKRSKAYIIGLTANALMLDEERCRDAGMDDFLPKPITLLSLEAALRRGLSAHASEADDVEPVPPAVVFEEQAFNDLRRQLGASDANEVLRAFLADSERRIARMRDDIASSNTRDIRREAHSMRSSAALFGFYELAQIARELEVESRRSTDAAQLLKLVDAAQNSFNAVLSLVNEKLNAA
jgi:signal transduction histidine kinase/CheY-like chemotaxis protein/HPt (histidine-containing phosphotransfer) domain-containing protein